MTPIQYAKQEIKAGRLVSMPVLHVAGSYYLCDSDWHILVGSKTYSSKDIATNDRSKILDRANKIIV